MNGMTPVQAFEKGLKLRPKTERKEGPVEAAETGAQAGAAVD